MKNKWKVILIISIALNGLLISFNSFNLKGKLAFQNASSEASPVPDIAGLSKIHNYPGVNQKKVKLFNEISAHISKNRSYYQEKVTQFLTFNVTQESIVFVGDSITDMGDWTQFFPNKKIINMGINSDTIQGVRDRLNLITYGKPAKLFIMIGTNDLAGKKSVNDLADNYEKMIETIRDQSPNTQVYVQSILPVNEDVWRKSKEGYLNKRNESNDRIKQLNQLVKNIALKNKATYIDLYPLFVDKNGNLNVKYSVSGLHLRGSGYKLWVNTIKNYVEQ